MSNGNSNLDSSTSTDSEHITTLLHSKMTLAYSEVMFMLPSGEVLLGRLPPTPEGWEREIIGMYYGPLPCADQMSATSLHNEECYMPYLPRGQSLEQLEPVLVHVPLYPRTDEQRQVPDSLIILGVPEQPRVASNVAPVTLPAPAMPRMNYALFPNTALGVANGFREPMIAAVPANSFQGATVAPGAVVAPGVANRFQGTMIPNGIRKPAPVSPLQNVWMPDITRPPPPLNHRGLPRSPPGARGGLHRRRRANN